MWFIITVIGNAILAVVAVMDKFILSKALKPAAFVFYSTVPAMLLFALIPFNVTFPVSVADWIIVCASGFFFALALWAMYRGFQESEVSHVGPLVGAATPFFVVVMGRLFLQEILTNQQVMGVATLIAGSLVISFEKSRRHNGWHRGMLWGVLAGLLYAISHITAKYAYDRYGFYSGFVWTKSAIGLFGLLMLAVLPSVRSLLTGIRFSGRHASSGSKAGLVFINKALGVLGVVLIQYAIAIGSVSLVNALGGLQYALLVVLVALLSRFWPRLFKEEYGGREVIQEVLAIVLIGLGLSLVIL